MGFSAMFVALGAGAAWFGNVLLTNRRPLEIVAGVLVILAAITFAGLPLPRLLRPSGDCRSGREGASSRQA